MTVTRSILLFILAALAEIGVRGPTRRSVTGIKTWLKMMDGVRIVAEGERYGEFAALRHGELNSETDGAVLWRHGLGKGVNVVVPGAWDWGGRGVCDAGDLRFCLRREKYSKQCE